MPSNYLSSFVTSARIVGVTVGVTTSGLLCGFAFGVSSVGVRSLLSANAPPNSIAVAWDYHFLQSVKLGVPLVTLAGGSLLGTAYSLSKLPQEDTIFGLTQAHQLALAGIAILSTIPFTRFVMWPNMKNIQAFVNKVDEAKVKGEEYQVDGPELIAYLNVWKRQAYIRAAILGVSTILGLTSLTL